MKKKPITEIILAVVLVVSLAAFFLLKDTGSGTQSHGSETESSEIVDESLEGLSFYEKDRLLMEASPEDEKTVKMLYLYDMAINKEIYFKYFVGHIGENIKYGGYVNGYVGKLGSGYEVCQLRVDSVEKYDEYEGIEKNEGETFVKVTYTAMNVSDEPYVWCLGSHTVSLMNEAGEIKYGVPTNRYSYYEYGFEPAFCEETIENRKFTYVLADYDTGNFLLPVGVPCSYSIIETLSKEDADADNLVATKSDESVKMSRDGVTVRYRNDGYRIYLNK